MKLMLLVGATTIHKPQLKTKKGQKVNKPIRETKDYRINASK